MVGLEFAVSEVPDLDQLVPATGYNDGIRGIRGEPHTGHPVSVAVILLLLNISKQTARYSPTHLDGVLAHP